MKVEIAKNAGFCFGVKRATDRLEKAIADGSGERIYTLGTLIHNDVYNRQLAEQGVAVTSIDEIPALAQTATESSPVRIFVRAHGIEREDEAILISLCKQNPYFSYEDCTCPYVKKIHKIAAEHSSDDHYFVLFGNPKHPEVVGILSYFDGEKFVFESADELKMAIDQGIFANCTKKSPVLAAQTTQNLGEWKKSQKIFKKLCTNRKRWSGNGSRYPQK